MGQTERRCGTGVMAVDAARGGVALRWMTISGMSERLFAAARAAGFQVRCAPTPDSRSAIVMIGHPDPSRAVKHLADNRIIVDYRPGFVRISPHFYNTDEELALVLEKMLDVK
jgi:selenocysteine lyase/cysteine desulfurase